MPQSTVSLVLRVSRSQGKRGHYAAVLGANGKVKPQIGMVDKKPTELPGSSYYLRYRVNGKRVWESVGKDPTLALQRQRQRESELKGMSLGLQPSPGSKIHEVVNRPAPAPDTPAMEYGVMVRDYAAGVEKRTRNKRTGNQYYRDLMEFRAAVGPKSPANVTQDDVRAFIKWMLSRNLSPKTIQNRLVTVRAFLRYHKQDGKAVDRRDAPKVHKKIPHTYTSTQLDKLLSASSLEDKLIWQVFLSAGLREQELTHLGWEDIIFERGIVHLHAKPDIGFRLKDAEERQIPLPKMLVEKLRERRENRPGDRLVFPTGDGKPDGHLLRRLKNIAFAAGLNCGLCVNRAGKSCKEHEVCSKWQLHSFRRTAANRWHEAGLTVPSVQKLLGHSDVETTMHYLTGQDITRAEFRDTMDRCFATLT